MKLALFSRLRRPSLSLLITALVLAACESTTEPGESPTHEVGVVLNSQDRSLTIFRVDDPGIRSTVGVGPDGSPVTLAVRGDLAVVPMGFVPAAVVVDLRSGAVLRTIGLAEGSGATGVAFLNDSVALVANPGLGTVSPLNVRTGQRGADVTVGRHPHAAVSVGDTVFVLNAELGPNFQPVGPGTVSVVTGAPLRVVKTITLRGTNPGAVATGPGGRLYVINSGRFGQNEGTLSVIDRASLTEVAHHTGFRSFPGSIAVANSRAYVAGFGIGLLVWDIQANAFIRGASDPVGPGGIFSTSAVGIDSMSRVYALEPECQTAGVAYRLTGTYAVQDEIPVGTCPITIAFTHAATPDD